FVGQQRPRQVLRKTTQSRTAAGKKAFADGDRVGNRTLSRSTERGCCAHAQRSRHDQVRKNGIVILALGENGKELFLRAQKSRSHLNFSIYQETFSWVGRIVSTFIQVRSGKP